MKNAMDFIDPANRLAVLEQVTAAVSYTHLRAHET